MDQSEIKSYVGHMRAQLQEWDTLAYKLTDDQRAEYQTEREQILKQLEMWDMVATVNWKRYVKANDKRIVALEKKWDQGK